MHSFPQHSAKMLSIVVKGFNMVIVSLN